MTPERECIAEIDIGVLRSALFHEFAFCEALLGFGQVESLLEVGDQDDEVRLFTQVSFFRTNDALHSKHLQPIKCQPAQLHVRLKVCLDQLCEPPRVVLVTVRDLNLNIQRRGPILVTLVLSILLSIDLIGHRDICFGLIITYS